MGLRSLAWGLRSLAWGMRSLGTTAAACTYQSVGS